MKPNGNRGVTALHENSACRRTSRFSLDLIRPLGNYLFRKPQHPPHNMINTMFDDDRRCLRSCNNSQVVSDDFDSGKKTTKKRKQPLGELRIFKLHLFICCAESF